MSTISAYVQAEAGPRGQPILSVEHLSVEFPAPGATARVLTDLNFALHPGETLGLVGESGCGKSMTALALMRLVPEPGRIGSGKVRLRERDLMRLGGAEMRAARGNEISMIFQEPMTALNPVYTVGDQLSEPLRQHQGLDRSQARQRAIEMLGLVGIPAAGRRVDDYPHQMSGGMRQRVMIAMALACDPAVLIADEPTTALDVTVQAQIFDLLREQQRQRGTAIILITHDMGAVSEMADRIVVMYGGRVVEEGLTDQVLAAPLHPYTRGLIACMPMLEVDPDPDVRPDLPEIPGVVPSIWERGQGCPFAPRCRQAMPVCTAAFPQAQVIESSHRVACWLYGEQTS